MIYCKDVTAHYGNFMAINRVRLSVEKNTTCAVIGKSGCGKTTFLHLLAGLLKPSSGLIEINGKPLKELRKQTGVILQEPGLFPWKNVWENVSLGLYVRNIDSEEIIKRVEEELKDLGLLNQKNKYPFELSGGQKQRVAIARAFVIHPDLLLMDEPTASLDMISKEVFQRQLLKQLKKHETTMMIVTHDIEEAVFLAEKIIVMEYGKVKHEIHNNLFGNEDIRNDLKFYEMCLRVRRILGEFDDENL